MDRDLVVIVDFGAQYAQLIARRVREAGVFSEILPAATRAQEVLARHPRGIILSGGPASVYEEGAPTLDPELWALGVPMLGICYGMQLMAHHLGGRVARGERREFGRACLEVAREDLLLAGIGTSLEVWMSHGDLILEPPPGFEVLARSGNAPVAVMADLARHLYGVQFHPEVVHTARGKDILANFLFRICGCRPGWNAASFIDEAVGEIRAQVGDGRAVCALSGGVDSSVAAALTHRAVGDRLTCVFVDTGLLRAGEPEQVEATFSGTFGIPLIHVRAADRFLDALAGVTDPEAKRRKVGELFIRIFEEEATRVGQLGRVDFLVQGTVYPDVIESGTGTAATIKTHHNVGGLPARMALKLVEPLRWLFKDEVRAVGEALGLPSQLVWRHPFPGPGLAVRIIGEVTPEKLAVVRAADAIVGEEVQRAGWYRRLWQAFAVLCDTRTVGVLGDARAYGYTVAVRAVISDDAMTADWARLPCEVLERISSRIVNEVPAVNRVVYDITSKPPATIEWE